MLRRPSRARRVQASLRREAVSPRGRAILGWTAAAGVLVALAFIVGRPGSEQEVLSSTPSPTPTPPLPIVFGTALDPASGIAIGSTNRFRAGDSFAYSVTLDAPPGTDSILVEVDKLSVDARSVVQEPSVQHILPSAPTFAFQVQTEDLLRAWGDGTFEMRIFLAAGGDPLAVGTFVLIASPPG